MEPLIRAATADDSGAIAYAAYLAGQGHCGVSTYDLMIPGRRPGPTAERIYQIKRLVEAESVCWLHYSHYRVAEVDGRVAASIGAFSAEDSGNLALIKALKETGWNDAEIARMSCEVRVYTRVEPPVPRNAWMIENAAVLPGFRRMGLMTALLDLVLAEGRCTGLKTALLACHMGNEAARRLYERAGFVITAQRTDTEFETIFGSPGMWQMTLDLRSPPL